MAHKASVPTQTMADPEEPSLSGTLPLSQTAGHKRHSFHYQYSPAIHRRDQAPELPAEDTALLSSKPTPKLNASWYHPSRFAYRLVVLIFSSLSIVSLYFAYDEIGAVAPMLQEQMGFTLYDIGWLYSIYSTPNILLALLGGQFVDSVGTSISGFVFAVLIIVGSTGVALSDGFWPMFCARLVLGIGGECQKVCQSRVLTEWFEEHELSFSMSVSMTAARLTGVALFNILPPIATSSLKLALWVVVGVAVGSFIAVLFTNFFSIMGQRILERDGFIQSHRKTTKEQRSMLESIAEFFGQLKDFSVEFWYLVTLNFTFFCLLAFVAFSTVYFTTKYDYSSVYAGQLTSVINLVSMILSTPVGILIDYIGRRHAMTIGGHILVPICLTLLAVTYWNPLPMMLLLGLAFSVVPCTIYTSIAYVVPPERMGVAFGITISCTNVGLVISPMIFGYLVDYSGYTAAVLSVAAFEVLGLLVALMLWWTDKAKLLDMPSAEAGRYAHEEQERRRKAKQKEADIELLDRSK